MGRSFGTHGQSRAPAIESVSRVVRWRDRIFPRQREFLANFLSVPRRRVNRLSRSVKLFYYMSLAPHTHSKLSIVDLLTGSAAIAPQISLDVTNGADVGAGLSEVAAGSLTRQRRNAYQRQAAHDTLTTSFGTLAFATMGANEGGKTVMSGLGGGGGGGGKVVAASEEEQVDDSSMPSWAEPGSTERRTLIELGCELTTPPRTARETASADTDTAETLQTWRKRCSKTIRPTNWTRSKFVSAE